MVIHLRMIWNKRSSSKHVVSRNKLFFLVVTNCLFPLPVVVSRSSQFRIMAVFWQHQATLKVMLSETANDSCLSLTIINWTEPSYHLIDSILFIIESLATDEIKSFGWTLNGPWLLSWSRPCLVSSVAWFFFGLAWQTEWD